MAVQRRAARLLGWSENSSTDFDYSWSPATYDASTPAYSSRTMAPLPALMLADVFITTTWVWTLSLANMLSGGRPAPKAALYIPSRFLFRWFSSQSGGASFNPVTSIAFAATGMGPRGVLATAIFRIPAQLAGAVLGVKSFLHVFPEYRGGPRLEVGMLQGAAVEFGLGFVMLAVYLGLKQAELGFAPYTLASSLFRMTIRRMGAGLTSGWINPVSAFAWAYMKGIHMTKEHLVVYWAAPFLAAFVAVRVYEWLEQAAGEDGQDKSWKSD